MVGNYGEGDSAYPREDLESDDDEPLSVTKKRDAPNKARDEDDTPADNTTSSQESKESGGATPEPKRKEIRTKADLEREIKREKVIDRAEKLLDSTQEFDPELEYYCSSLMPLLEKLEFEKRQCCMIAIRQTIFTFMFPRCETAARPMSVHHYMAGGAAANPLPPAPAAAPQQMRTPPPAPRLQAQVRIDPHPQYVPAPVQPMEPDEGVEDILLMRNCEFADAKPHHTS